MRPIVWLTAAFAFFLATPVLVCVVATAFGANIPSDAWGISAVVGALSLLVMLMTVILGGDD